MSYKRIDKAAETGLYRLMAKASRIYEGPFSECDEAYSVGLREGMRAAIELLGFEEVEEGCTSHIVRVRDVTKVGRC